MPFTKPGLDESNRLITICLPCAESRDRRGIMSDKLYARKSFREGKKTAGEFFKSRSRPPGTRDPRNRRNNQCEAIRRLLRGDCSMPIEPHRFTAASFYRRFARTLFIAGRMSPTYRADSHYHTAAM